MKLLIKGSKDTVVEDPNQVVINIEQLDKISDGSCSQIVIDDILDYYTDRDQLLQTIIGKMRYNSTIYITGVDIYETSRAIMSGNTSKDEALNILYGDGKRSIDSLDSMCSKVNALKIDISERTLSGCFYKITGRRPGIDNKS